MCTYYTTHPSGGRAGLETSKVLRAENDEIRRRREKELMERDPSMLGKEVDTVIVINIVEELTPSWRN